MLISCVLVGFSLIFPYDQWTYDPGPQLIIAPCTTSVLHARVNVKLAVIFRHPTSVLLIL